MADLSRSEMGAYTENLNRFPNLRFEAGDHLKEEEDLKTLANRISSGDLRAHPWNKEVSTRLREYGPQILGIDGLIPSTPTQNPELQYLVKYNTWQLLPDRPSQLNNQKSIIVVAGDVGDDLGSNYLTSGLYEPIDRAAAINAEKAVNSSLNSDSLKFFPKFLSESGSGSTLGAAYLLFAGIKSLESTDTISRRNLLTGLGMGGGIAVFSSFLRAASILAPENILTTTTNERDRKIWQDLVSITSPKVFKFQWIDFRTALVLTKTESAIEFLHSSPSTPASVLMGFTHAAEAKTIQEDQNYRVHLIRDFVDYLFKALDSVLVNFPDVPDSSYVKIKQNLINQIAKVDLLEVRDPGGPDQVSDIKKFIQDSVVSIGTFQSPQVRSAIAYKI